MKQEKNTEYDATLNQEVNDWIESVWSKATDDWTARDQDINYRRYVVHPAIEQQVQMLEPVPRGNYLDVGCGDGDETIFLRGLLEMQNFSGKLYGFDIQPGLIEEAKRKDDGKSKIHTFFDSGTLEELIEKHDLTGKADMVYSSFAFQEIPFLRDSIHDMTRALRPNGTLLSIFVHPQFEDILKDKGHIRVNPDLCHPSWGYCGEYPIVEEDRIFYVPVFHRNLAEYIIIIEESFYIQTIEGLKPSVDVIKRAETERISPFYKHDNNVYHPEILELPSSVLIRCVKK